MHCSNNSNSCYLGKNVDFSNSILGPEATNTKGLHPISLAVHTVPEVMAYRSKLQERHVCRYYSGHHLYSECELVKDNNYKRSNPQSSETEDQPSEAEEQPAVTEAKPEEEAGQPAEKHETAKASIPGKDDSRSEMGL